MQCCVALFLAVCHQSSAGVVTYSKSSPLVIVTQPSASLQEKLAAKELAAWLEKIVSQPIKQIQTTVAPHNSIVVGQGTLARQLLPKLNWENLDDEEVVIQSVGSSVVIAGGRPRGTIYAVNRFLNRQGVRWWTPWATTVPHKSVLQWKGLSIRETPTFEARDPFWFHAFDRDWARRNNANSMHSRLTEEDGGKITYEGFVHTYYPLVPTSKYFSVHPEWYSEINGKRTGENAQLCTTNPALRDFVVDQVRSLLEKNPSVRIVSVSQNDCYNPCQCEKCRALYQAEGSESAGVLSLANYVAEKIEKDYPKVAIDTLAYQWSRHAPKSMKPRPNVIVRLCSIECGFSKPLTDPSNSTFMKDVVDWSRLTKRLYVWNYVTDFPNYMQPFPNWFVIGPNERFFADNGVKGLFEQGAYQSYGSSMAELHAWVQAQLLWNPHQDDRELIREFLKGYYGKAAPHIETYMNLLANKASKTQMGIWVGPDAKFFDAKTILMCEKYWQEAEKAVSKEPEVLWRVRIGHLALRYVILSRWVQLRRDAQQYGLKWELPESRKVVADDWIKLAKSPGPVGWSPITMMNESGYTPEQWIKRFEFDPLPPTPVNRVKENSLPKDIVVPDGAKTVVVQDDEAKLYNEGDWAEFRQDVFASDHAAARLAGTNHEWAFQLPALKLPEQIFKGKWKVYLVARVEPGADLTKTAFTAGVYSEDSQKGLGGASPTCVEMGKNYRSVLLTTTSLSKGSYVWAAAADSNSKAVWIDRVVFVQDK